MLVFSALIAGIRNCRAAAAAAWSGPSSSALPAHRMGWSGRLAASVSASGVEFFTTGATTTSAVVVVVAALDNKKSNQYNRYQRNRHGGCYRSSTATALYSSSTEVDPGIVPGTELRICKYPHPALRAPNALITEAELNEVAQLAKEMFKVMYASQGVGLAAPQVGINKRLMVYNPTGDPSKWIEEVIMINPRIVEYSTAKDIDLEACLSFPNMSGDVERSKWIKVEALNVRGKTMKRKFTGWEARIFQHEYDHLDGVVYIDRLTSEGRKLVQPTLDILIQEYGSEGAL